MPAEITVERGMKKYLSENSDACRIVIRNSDDPAAAAGGLARFRDDLWTSDVFAPLDGVFGRDVDGSILRYSPSFASEVELGADGPEFWFDAQGVLESQPALVDDLLSRLTRRLAEAGVGRAQIGKPRRPYYDRAYAPEADWFHGHAEYLKPLDERWVPPDFPAALAVPANSRVVVAHRAHDGTWTHLTWRRRAAQDDFADTLAGWQAHGLTVEPLDAPPTPPPDIAWGWHLIHRAFTLTGDDGTGWAWTRFPQSERVSYLHVVWFP